MKCVETLKLDNEMCGNIYLIPYWNELQQICQFWYWIFQLDWESFFKELENISIAIENGSGNLTCGDPGNRHVKYLTQLVIYLPLVLHISIRLTTFSCFSNFRIRISRSAVIGNWNINEIHTNYIWFHTYKNPSQLNLIF
jgi:hypothetical protein